ncbi:MAG: DUF3857 and transglutaminase domain-containing protein [Acidobacteriota bacterium]
MEVPAPVTDAGTDQATGESRLRLIDRQIHLPAAGSVESYIDRQIHLASDGDVDVWGSWEVAFQPSYQRIELHRLEVLRQGRWDDRLAGSRLAVIQREDDLRHQILDQRHLLVILVDDLRPLDTLRLAYTIFGQNPVFGGKFFERLPLRFHLPIDEFRVHVHGAEGRPLRWQVFDPKADAAEAAPRQVAQVGELSSQDIRWQGQDLEASEDWWFSMSDVPMLEVSEFADWQAVARWAAPLYRSRERPAELRRLADEIRQLHATPGARLVAARNWVQDEIRYLALALGNHSQEPYATPEILRRRYGDCKDKTALLISLLDDLEIAAWPALVHSERRAAIRHQVPSPAAFDHAIVTAEVAGERIFIDPTLTHQGGQKAADIHHPSFGRVLEVRPDTTALSEIPPPPGGRIDSTYRYTIQHGEGSSTVVIETAHQGVHAEGLRRQLASSSRQQIQENYLEFYNRSPHRVSPRADLELTDDRSANRIFVREHYEVTRDDPDQYFFEALPLVAQTQLSYSEGASEVDLPHPLHLEEHVVLIGASGDLEPIAEEISNPWFRFSVSSLRLANGLRLDYHLETVSAQVEGSEIATYEKDLDRFYDSLGYRLWISEEEGEGETMPAKTLVVGALAVFTTIVGGAVLLGALAAFLWFLVERSRHRP